MDPARLLPRIIQVGWMKRSRKMWTGIGVVTLSQAISSATQGAHPVPESSGAAPYTHRTAGPPRADAAGEAGKPSGETYLRDGGPSDTRVRLSRDLILLHGYALAADASVTVGDWAAATAHILASTEELRTKLEPYMKGQGVRPFAPEMARLTTAIERKDAALYAQARVDLDAHMARAGAAIKKFQVPYHRFILRAAIEALKAASSAYDAAVSDGRIADAVEYRDSRGFARAAGQAIVSIRGDLDRVDAAAALRIDQQLAALGATWPAGVAVPVRVMSAADVAALVSDIEVTARAF